eukprot:gb/GEZJ01000805.1/.p1 GENE.gb/GEZJ01000805.1/~~gb/GEZJ01000805.1/.p1  ORF type:complete len:295 (-),score=7.42 gb/GEZJ01000805.1/:553-1437(-)
MKPSIFTAVLFASFVSLSFASYVFPGRIAPGPPFPITCAVVRCASGTQCIETKKGPQCVPFVPPQPASCAVILCFEGTKCVESPEGAKCVPFNEPLPHPEPPTDPDVPSDCSKLECASDQFCIETPSGPQCTPDTGCAAVTCAIGTRCIVTPDGPTCEPIDPPSPDTCACIQIFDPVCCKYANGDVRTAGNSCECSGCNSRNEVLYSGACRPTSCAAVDCAPGFVCVVKDSVAQCVKSVDSCVCPLLFDPVCCRSASGIATKSNSCFCGCEPSGSVLFKGKCPSFSSGKSLNKS